ncbi:MAG: hypothetical protein M9894_01395 [Planctomycetes bacterium]|nr:hypothetical protein [Planctomycetota bacterium]
MDSPMLVGRTRYAARARVGALMGTRIIDNRKSPRCEQDLWNAGLSGRVDIKNLYVNSEAFRETSVWKDFLGALEDYRENHAQLPKADRRVSTDLQLALGSLTVEVVHPSATLAIAGASNARESNALSGVIRVSAGADPLVLFGADLSTAGLASIKDRSKLRAKLLVFPHHGGNAGGPLVAFTEELMNCVLPSAVFISMGRNRFMNPQPEVVQTIRRKHAGAHLACTQLSKHCCDRGAGRRTGPLPSAGTTSGVACAGSLKVQIDTATGATKFLPPLSDHANFVRGVKNRLCK